EGSAPDMESALPGWGRQGRAPPSAAYFFFFLEAFFFFAIVSPPSAPRVPRLMISAGILGEPPETCQGENTICGVTRPSRTLDLEGNGDLQVLSRADDGRRCSRRRTNSWLSATPFLHIGHCSGGYVGKSRLTRLKISLPATSDFLVRRHRAP